MNTVLKHIVKKKVRIKNSKYVLHKYYLSLDIIKIFYREKSKYLKLVEIKKELKWISNKSNLAPWRLEVGKFNSNNIS